MFEPILFTERKKRFKMAASASTWEDEDDINSSLFNSNRTVSIRIEGMRQFLSEAVPFQRMYLNNDILWVTKVDRLQISHVRFLSDRQILQTLHSQRRHLVDHCSVGKERPLIKHSLFSKLKYAKSILFRDDVQQLCE